MEERLNLAWKTLEKSKDRLSIMFNIEATQNIFGVHHVTH
jgi:hypothetical protein